MGNNTVLDDSLDAIYTSHADVHILSHSVEQLKITQQKMAGLLHLLTSFTIHSQAHTHTTLLSYTRAYTYSSLFGLSYPTPCCVIFVCIKSMKVILPVFIVFNFFTIFIIQKTPYQLITAIIMLNILQQQKSACLYIVF